MIIGTAEVEIKAKVDAFERQLRSELGATGGALGKFGGLADRANASLGKFGLTTRDVGIVLGTGLAGGAAFAAREVIRFTASAIEAASALEEQRAASEVVFEANSKLVQSFAEGAAAIGLSERAALQATTTFGGFFQNIGLGERAASKLAIGFTALASDTASLFDLEPEVAIERIISGLRGEQDAVERLNVSINEKVVADRALADSGKKSADQLTQGEKILARSAIIFEQLTVAQNNFRDTSDGLANSQRVLNAEWENAKAALGDAIQPAAIAVTKALTAQIQAVRDLNDGYENLENSVKLAGIGFRTSIDGRETNALEKLRDIVFGFGGDADEAADNTQEFADAIAELNDPLNKAAVAAGRLSDETDKLADAEKRLNRALEDAERNVDRAEKRLARAQKDGARRVRRASKDVADAEEDGLERIADAEEKLKEIREGAADDVKDAKRDLRDLVRDAAQETADGERRVAEARKQRASAIQDAQIALERAQASGDADAENEARRNLAKVRADRSVADAERDLAEQKKQRDRDIARLEEELADARVEAADKVKDAEEDLADTVEETAERIKDAKRSLRDAQRESAEAIIDAEVAVADAVRDGAEAVDDARTAFDRMGSEVEEARTGVQLLTKDVDLLTAALDKVASNPVFRFSDPVFPEGRAEGGDIFAGRSYFTGEKGIELVSPKRNSTVTSNADIIAALRDAFGGGGSAGPNVNVNVSHQDPQVLANVLKRMLVQGLD